MPSPVVNTAVITAVERICFFDSALGQWVVSDVLPGTTKKIGHQDFYLDRYIWTQTKPPPDLRVTTTRPG